MKIDDLPLNAILSFRRTTIKAEAEHHGSCILTGDGPWWMATISERCAHCGSGTSFPWIKASSPSYGSAVIMALGKWQEWSQHGKPHPVEKSQPEVPENQNEAKP